MIFFCPECWGEIPPASAVCPSCGADQALADAQPFGVKLRRALRHPEPQTPLRATWILGELRETSAVPDLIEIVAAAKDSFLIAAAAEALGKIGDRRALPVLERAALQGTRRVRRSAQLAIRRLLGDSAEPNSSLESTGA